MKWKEHSLFKRIFVSVFIPEFIIFFVAMYINYSDTTKMFKQEIDNHNKAIRLQLNHIIILQDWLLDLLETKIDERTEHFSHILSTEIFASTDSISSADLHRIKEKIKMNSELEDIYIINDRGIIINTTFDPDSGLNIISLDSSYADIFSDIRSEKKYYTDGFSIEHKTKKLRKFSYTSSQDGKFIIELGMYSTEALRLMGMISDKIQKIQELNESVLSINVFLEKEDPVNLYSKDSLDALESQIFRSVIENGKDSVTVVGNQQKQFLFFETKNKKGAIMVRYDLDVNQAKLGKLVTEGIVIFLISIGVLGLVLFFNIRDMIKPINGLIDGLHNFGEGNLKSRVEINGTMEISKIATEFNAMADQVQGFHNELKTKHEEITASINYAKRIQTALLTSDEYWKQISAEHFVYFKPRDIVSGDFFWAYHTNTDLAIWVAADCTGHGVPGAFMSMLGVGFLNEIVAENGFTQADVILNKLREKIINALEQKGLDVQQQDGMDIALCVWDKKRDLLQYSGAYNPLYVISGNEKKGFEHIQKTDSGYFLYEIKADKQPVGKHHHKIVPFTFNEIPLEKGDMIYTFSDGYMDQFGGDKNKKFTVKRFKNILLDIQGLSMEEQKRMLDVKFMEWMRDYEQSDDVCVVGVKV